jgi:hypothetical protein
MLSESLRDNAAAGLGDTGAAFQQVAQSDGAFHQRAGVIAERPHPSLARHQSLEKALQPDTLLQRTVIAASSGSGVIKIQSIQYMEGPAPLSHFSGLTLVGVG